MLSRIWIQTFAAEVALRRYHCRWNQLGLWVLPRAGCGLLQSRPNLGAIIAKSFARIYYRNCLNNALPAIVCPEAVDAIENGETGDYQSGKRDYQLRSGGIQFSTPAGSSDGDILMPGV